MYLLPHDTNDTFLQGVRRSWGTLRLASLEDLAGLLRTSSLDRATITAVCHHTF
jgi:hypothetical protein